MYKTVRHGENSLQYTILPQTEEVLINNGLKGKGRNYSPSIHMPTSRRKYIVKYILLSIFGVIFALAIASVPLYVMNGALYGDNNQFEHDAVTTAPFTHAGMEIAKTRKKDLKSLPDSISPLQLKKEISTTLPTTTTVTTITPTQVVTSERATTPPWMPALKSWKSLTSTIQPIPTEVPTEVRVSFIETSTNSNRLQGSNRSAKIWEKDIIIRPTMTPEPTLRSIIKHYSRSHATSEKTRANYRVLDDALITTKSTTIRTPVTTEFTTTSENYNMRDLKDTMLSVDDDDDFKESLEVDEVFSLPPLKPESAAPVDSDEVTVAKAGDPSWYAARWPFVDTSSYYQWAGYTTGDNLLLPLLVATMSSIALVLVLVLTVKGRKRSQEASAEIGKLTADLQADDNTNLLADTVEDAEE